MTNKIIIIAGDPNSINSEIIFKAWKKINPKIKKKIIIIANYNLLATQANRLNFNLRLKKIKNINERLNTQFLNILDYKLKFKNCFNVSKRLASNYVMGCIDLAHKLSSQKKIKGFINCPIDKKLINKNNRVYGVTELLAKKSKIAKSSEVMLLFNKKLSVSPITTHLKVKEISKKIKKKVIISKIKTLLKFYKVNFNKIPKIAILGLNPHNGEYLKETEEIKEIIPAINALKKIKKININGPKSADSFFIHEFKKFDLVVGMYHDQVLIPFKNLFKFNAINITLGLKYIRISPDHGTAKDKIGKNVANPESIIHCIKFLNSFNN